MDDQGVPGAPWEHSETIVGTPNYMPPEQFNGEAYSFYVDFWAAAVLLHELLSGETIGRRDKPTIAKDAPMMDATAADLLERMLTPSRERRLGCGDDGLAAIKRHAYFAGVDFEALLKKAAPGPLIEGMGSLKKTTADDRASFFRTMHGATKPAARGAEAEQRSSLLPPATQAPPQTQAQRVRPHLSLDGEQQQGQQLRQRVGEGIRTS